MALQYPIPEELNQIWGGAQDWLKNLLGNIFDPNKQSQPPAFQGAQQPQGLPQMIANMLMAGQETPKGAYESGIPGMGMMPLIPYENFRSSLEKELMNNVKSSYMYYEDNLNKFNTTRNNYYKNYVDKGLEWLKRDIREYGNTMKAVDKIGTIDQPDRITAPISKISSKMPENLKNRYDFAFNKPGALYIPEEKYMNINIQKEDRPDSIFSKLIHELVHAHQWEEPLTPNFIDMRQKMIPNIDLYNIMDKYHSNDVLMPFLEKNFPYLKSRYSYFTNPRELQAYGVANEITDKFYPGGYQVQPYWPETYNQGFKEAADYILNKLGK